MKFSYQPICDVSSVNVIKSPFGAGPHAKFRSYTGDGNAVYKLWGSKGHGEIDIWTDSSS